MDRTIALREGLGLHAARGSAQPLAFFRSGNVSLACVPSRRPYRFSRSARSSENSPAADSFLSRAPPTSRPPLFLVAPDRRRQMMWDKARAVAARVAATRRCRGCFRIADDETQLRSESTTAEKSSQALPIAARRSPNARGRARTHGSDNSARPQPAHPTSSRKPQLQLRRSSR
jgi:hypothetical protein